jgi:hypothetical protein
MFRGLAHGVLLVVCKDHHVVSLVAEVLVQERRHVLHVVDTAAQLPPLPKVVYANKKSFSSPCAIWILERIALRFG